MQWGVEREGGSTRATYSPTPPARRAAWFTRAGFRGCASRGGALLGGGVLGDGLGALGHGVLGELTGEEEADRGLDLPGGEGRLLVVPGEADGLGGRRSKVSFTNEFMIDMARLEMPVSGCTCLSTL